MFLNRTDISGVHICRVSEQEAIHQTHRRHHKSKVYLWLGTFYTAAQHRSIYQEIPMSNQTITQAQSKRLRHHFTNAYSAVRAFSGALYAAHGGWHPARLARGGRTQRSASAGA
jgi:hypothetical protein